MFVLNLKQLYEKNIEHLSWCISTSFLLTDDDEDDEGEELNEKVISFVDEVDSVESVELVDSFMNLVVSCECILGL